jgi:hypothetical protein
MVAPGLTRVTPYAGMLRNGGPAWPGTLARHAPESVAGMARNPQTAMRRLYSNGRAADFVVNPFVEFLDSASRVQLA